MLRFVSFKNISKGELITLAPMGQCPCVLFVPSYSPFNYPKLQKPPDSTEKTCVWFRFTTNPPPPNLTHAYNFLHHAPIPCSQVPVIREAGLPRSELPRPPTQARNHSHLHDGHRVRPPTSHESPRLHRGSERAHVESAVERQPRGGRRFGRGFCRRGVGAR